MFFLKPRNVLIGPLKQHPQFSETYYCWLFGDCRKIKRLTISFPIADIAECWVLVTTGVQTAWVRTFVLEDKLNYGPALFCAAGHLTESLKDAVCECASESWGYRSTVGVRVIQRWRWAYGAETYPPGEACLPQPPQLCFTVTGQPPRHGQRQTQCTPPWGQVLFFAL